MGTTSAIADRFNILNNLTTFTPVSLDAQMVINNQNGGSCNGGDPTSVYQLAFEEGLVSSSCEQYIAYNLLHSPYPINTCMDCTYPPPAANESGTSNCYAVSSTKYYVSNYYSIRGVDQMKTEL